MSGNSFCGFSLDWNYKEGYVDISMSGYVKKALQKLQYIQKIYPQYSLHDFTPIVYGSKGKQQLCNEDQVSPYLLLSEILYIQSTVGSFLYYGRAIDSSILPALNEIGTTQAQPTEKTKKECQRLMDYLNTYPDVKIRFYKSDMQLHIDSDAAYLVLPKARSHIAGYFQFPSIHTDINGAILVECKGLKHVVSSAAEAEMSGIFHNAQTAVPIRRILEGLGHPQKATRIKTDNTTALGFIHKNIHGRKSKTWNMRMNWVKDRQQQKEFDVYWAKGADNNTDYFTKNHPVRHHRLVHTRYYRDTLNTCHNNLLSAISKLKKRQ